MNKMTLEKHNRVPLFLIFLFLLSSPAFTQQPLTLEDCREKALEQNKKIRVAQEDVKVATLTKKSMTTKYLPKVSLEGGYLHTNKGLKLLENDLFLPVVPFNTIDAQTGAFNSASLEDPATAINTLVINPQTGKPMLDAAGNPVFKNYAMLPAEKLIINNKNKYFAQLSVKQPLFTGFKIVEANKIAKHAENIAHNNVTLTQAEVLVKTDIAYWRVISLQEKVKLASSYEDLLNKLVTDLQNMYEEGIITNNDLLKAKVKQNEAKLKVLKAENGLALSKMALAQLIGLDKAEIVLPENTLHNEEITTNALNPVVNPDNRVEIMMLKDKISIMESNKNIERSKFMPNILLTGGYRWMNPNPYNGLKSEFGGDWSVGVVLSMPIFTWGERKHDLNAAKINRLKTEIELEDAKEMIDLQVHQNQYKYTESIKKAELTKLSKQQAEENLRMSEENLLEGRIRLTELLEAQVQWEEASSEYIDALIEVKTTISELEKSTGEIYKYLKK